MNNKLLIGIWLCIAITQSSFSQQPIPGVGWQRTFGGSGHDGGGGTSVYDSLHTNFKSLLKTRDGGFIVGTTTYSSDGDAAGNIGSGKIWISKVDSSGTIQWKNFFGIINQWNLLGAVIEAAGGGYLMIGSSKAGDDNLANNPNADDVLLVKINEDGQVAWQRKYGGTGVDRGYSIVKNKTTGYTLVGYTESSDGHAISPGKGAGDLWLLNIDPDGNLLNERKFGGSAEDCGAIVKLAADGGLIIAGSTYSGNGDLPASKGRQDIWLLKLAASGAIEWSKVYGGSNFEAVQDLSEDIAGGYVFTGSTESNNGDVSGNHGSSDAWIVKVNAGGQIVWQNCIGGNSQDLGPALTILPGPFYLLAGSTYSNNGNISAYKGNGDIFLSELDGAGSVLWTKTIGGSGFDFPYAVTSDLNKHIYILGETQSNDGDVSGNHGSTDLWLCKLGSINSFSGVAYYDFNHNGVMDGSDVFAENVTIDVEKAGLLKSGVINEGSYKVDVDLGSYTITARSPNGYFSVIPSTTTVTFTDYFNTETINFALQPLPGKQDLKVSIVALTPARPGFAASYLINYENSGNPVTDGRIELTVDPHLEVVNTFPATTTMENGKRIWMLPLLPTGSQGNIMINCTVKTPPTVNNGDTLKLIATILPFGDDLTGADNVSKLNQLVVGSFDPNDKQENNGGVITPQQVNAGEPLTYLIRFQNTGTDTAFTVVVRDTLTDKVIAGTLHMINASHPYNLQIQNGNQLTWTFDKIHLVDSNRNEPMSHGFIAYQVKPIPSLIVGDTVKNSASIYFDYNLPVETNTQLTIMKDLLALPLKLGYFKAIRAEAGVDLLWKVFQQSGFSHFEIEKSYDGSRFIKLAKINGERSSAVKLYRYTDEGQLEANNYYRLKMIDIDGSFEYSQVVLVQAKDDKTMIFSVSPNPASQQVVVDLDGDVVGHLSIRIIDQVGRIQNTINLGNQDTKSIRIPVSITRLIPGTYFLQVRLDERIFTKKIVVR